MNELDLRKEYNKLRDNGTLSIMLGSVCSNCGEEENIEYHHIVPIHLGGTNRLSNIVPLCNKCHKAAHNGRHMQEFRNQKCGGRRSNVSDRDAFNALDMWADGQIGSRKCFELMGRKYASVSGIGKVSDSTQYKKWCKKRGYKSVKNTLDIAATMRTCGFDENTVVGYITHLDGTETEIHFHDTRMNDGIEYKIRGKDERKPFREIKCANQDISGQFRFA